MPRSGTDNTAIALEHLICLHHGDHGDDVIMHTGCDRHTDNLDVFIGFSRCVRTGDSCTETHG